MGRSWIGQHPESGEERWKAYQGIVGDQGVRTLADDGAILLVQIGVDNMFVTGQNKADWHVGIYDAAPEGTGEDCEGVEETIVDAHGHEDRDAEEEDGLEDHLVDGWEVCGCSEGGKSCFGKK